MGTSYLAIDTSTEACSVALSAGGEVSFRYTEQPRQHANSVLPMVDSLLAEAGMTPCQLDGLVFSRGPGAFTGLRIGAGVVQGLAYALDLPVVCVSSLAVTAQRLYREKGFTAIHCAFDARMNEVYWGSYRVNSEGLAILMGVEQVIEPANLSLSDDIISLEEEWVGASNGWAFRDAICSGNVIVSKIFDDVLPHAQDALTLAVPYFERGETKKAEQVLPVYLRNKVAKKKGE